MCLNSNRRCLLELMGRLGWLLHYRCRQCGLWYTRKSRAKGERT